MEIRNIAIIAHVDHGKTTLTDSLLRQTGMVEDNTSMDSNSIEQERGITIYAKNCSLFYRDTKINIVDTPGHADFSSEVERVLRSIDSVLLVVDAQEGPMPQTKFVLKKSLELGLKPIVVINKIDKQLADVQKTLEATNDLFLELATDTEHLEFPVFYAIGREGRAGATLEELKISTNLEPILNEIITFIPAPKVAEGTFQMLVSNLDYDAHKGKHAIGRISRGSLKKGQSLALINLEGKVVPGRAESIRLSHGLKKIEVEEAPSGDIVDVTGLQTVTIGDTIADASNPEALPRIYLEEPTIKIGITANTSPFAGREGKFTNSRQILKQKGIIMSTENTLDYKHTLNLPKTSLSMKANATTLIISIITSFIASVIAFAKANGLTVTDTSPNNLVLGLSGIVTNVEKAFNVKMQVYKHPTEDRTFFAPDAEPSLNKLVQIMNDNPVTVELGAHADCRGSDAYNMILTEKRAASVPRNTTDTIWTGNSFNHKYQINQ